MYTRSTFLNNTKITPFMSFFFIPLSLQNTFCKVLCSNINVINHGFHANWLGVKNPGKLTLVGTVYCYIFILGINSTFFQFNKTCCPSWVHPRSNTYTTSISFSECLYKDVISVKQALKYLLLQAVTTAFVLNLLASKFKHLSTNT